MNIPVIKIPALYVSYLVIIRDIYLLIFQHLSIIRDYLYRFVWKLVCASE